MISFDPLEPRLLLAASLSGGVLTIVGTSAADQIEISHPALPRNSPSDQLVPNISRTLVRINQDDYEFSTSDIQRLVIHAGAGDDFIKIGRILPPSNVCGAIQMPHDSLYFSPAIPTLILGKSGDDTILASSGSDTILGGDGADSIMGWNGNDHIFGGRGDDLLH